MSPEINLVQEDVMYYQQNLGSAYKKGHLHGTCHTYLYYESVSKVK